MSLFEDMSHLAEELRQSYDSRIAAVNALNTATTRQLADLHTQHSALAERQRLQLADSAEMLRRDVAAMLHDMQVERATLAADQHRRLEAYATELRKTTDHQLAELAAARKAMGASQHQALAAFHLELQQRTNAALSNANADRQAIHNDHAAARQAWRRFNGEMQLRRSGHSQPAEPHQ
jgi:hypothetical protein